MTRASNGMALQEFCNCDFKNLCAIFRSAIAIIYMRLRLQLRFLLAIAIAIAIFMLILKFLQCHAIAILMPLICSHLVTLSESLLFFVLSIKTILTKFKIIGQASCRASHYTCSRLLTALINLLTREISIH